MGIPVGGIIKGGKAIVKGIEVAIEVIEAINALGVQLAPEQKTLLVPQLVHQAAGGAAVAVDGMKNAADNGLKAFEKLPKAAMDPIKKAFFDPVKGKFDERKLAKVVRDAQQKLLAHANASLKASDFLKKRKSEEKNSMTDFGEIACPGCYVIATYSKLDFDKDLTDFIGIYIGKNTNMGNGIAQDLSKEGNPDLYADIKYKQNVRIFTYICTADEIDEKFELLQNALISDKSYNY